MKGLKIILIVVVVLLVGIAVSKVFIKEDTQFTTGVDTCSSDEDPRVAASIHFDNPLQRLLTLKTVVTGKDDGAVYVSGYTLFGTELTKARVTCIEGEVGGIETIKSFFW